MLKTLSAYIGEYKRVSIKTPIYIIVEVVMEILIPFVTASIIDKGIQAGTGRTRHLSTATSSITAAPTGAAFPKRTPLPGRMR